MLFAAFEGWNQDMPKTDLRTSRDPSAHPSRCPVAGAVAVRAEVTEHGDEQDLADLAAAENELCERRSRKGGRPRGSRNANGEAAG
jgi:hypothetical protein